MKKQEETEKKEKSLYQQIIDGDREPEASQKGWINLEKRKSFNTWDPEKLHEVAVMGGKAVQELHGKKRTAREALEGILTLKVTDDILAGADLSDELIQRIKRSNPDLTVYDLIQAVAVGRAVAGNMKSYELIRDTYGDKPIERLAVTDDVTTEADRELMRQIADRLGTAESLLIVEDQAADPADNK